MHTLNIRLFPEDLAYIVEHAQDSVVIVDNSLWPAWEKVAAKVNCVKHVIVINDTDGPLPDGALDYEQLIAPETEAEFADVARRQRGRDVLHVGHDRPPQGRRLQPSLQRPPRLHGR